LEETSISAVDVASTALEVKGILSTVANFSAAMKFLSLALMIFAVILAVYVGKKLIVAIYKNIILGIFSIPKKIFKFIFGRNSLQRSARNSATNPVTNSDSSPPSWMSRNISADEVEFAVIKIVNDDNNILNNKNDKKNAKAIKNKLVDSDKDFEKVDLQVFEENITKIRKNVELRMKIYSVLKNNPRMITSSSSAITKTICSNLEVKDDELKNKFAEQVEIVKKIYELYLNAEDIEKIFEKTHAFEFELKLFIKIFANG